jgi:tetratricopeptide (TPR) repeat protein
MRINSPTDPFFKDRIKITKVPHPLKKWTMMIGIILLSVMVYYRFPDIIQHITPEITRPIAHEDTHTLTLSHSPKTVAPTEQLENETVVVSTVPVTKSSETVERLLAKAKAQIAKTQYTSPKADNAYETYQTLLKTAPQQAQQILDTIVAWYFEQAQKYISTSQLIQPKGDNAYNKYQQLREIAPQHQTTQTLLSHIVDALNQRAKQQMAKHRYTTPKNDNAADTYRQILKIAPDNAQALNGLNEIIEKYYGLALREQKRGRYKASMIWIERGLQIDPDNPKLNQLKLGRPN